MSSDIGPIRSSIPLGDVSESTWDVVVVGAGPAGSLAARESARLGLRTLLIDKSEFPRAKVCGGCLNAAALDVLRRVGLADRVRNLGAEPIERIELVLPARQAHLKLPGGASISRRRLDAMLVQSAVAAGARLLAPAPARVGPCDGERRTVTMRHPDGSATAGARVVILASGLSSVNRIPDPDLSQTIAARSRLGAGCMAPTAAPEIAPGTIYMVCGRHGYVGLVRVEEGRLNLAAALDPAWAKQAGGVGRAALQLLADAGIDPPAALAEQSWQATPLLTRQTSRVAARRLLVVGDAAGYVEPFTGEGMAWALASGSAVASVISKVRVGWDAEMERRWTRIHRRLVGNRQRVCRGIAWLLRRPELLRCAFHLLHLRPGAARPLIRHLNRPFP